MEKIYDRVDGQKIRLTPEEFSRVKEIMEGGNTYQITIEESIRRQELFGELLGLSLDFLAGKHWTLDVVGDGVIRANTPASSGITIGKEMFDLLDDTNMLQVHDDNGPEHIACPVCLATVMMKWKNGRMLTESHEVPHTEHCPVAYAQRLSGYLPS